MILAFYLSMSNTPSYNGRWTGEGEKRVIVKTFRSRDQILNAEKILKTGCYYYRLPNGWTAGITVEKVDSKVAKKLRKESQGFLGYGWMVDTICRCDKPMTTNDIKQHQLFHHNVKQGD